MSEQALAQGFPSTYIQESTTILMEPFSMEERLITLGRGHIALPLTDDSREV